MPNATPSAPALGPTLDPATAARLRALAARWSGPGGAERANLQSYVRELCDALGVEPPRPGEAAPDYATAYQFEFPVARTGRDGRTTTTFVDVYKAGHFVCEGKDSAAAATGESTLRLLTRAYGQAVNYARDLPERPPYVLVLDVGATLLAWDRWSGTYGGFHAARRVDLRTLADRPDDALFVRDVFEDPARRDPRRHAQAVTEEIAAVLGRLAKGLEDAGHDNERVARFLIRCVFSMFAEDVGLLPDHTFRQLLSATAGETAEDFAEAVEALWAAMDAGGRFGIRRLLRFNGHFFREAGGGPARALPLGAAERRLLLRAAEADWAQVEPSIFGTLLVRALSPEERHRLGAEYTPRAFIERLVRPTVEEPVRALGGGAGGGAAARGPRAPGGQAQRRGGAPGVPRLAARGARARPGVRERQLPVRDDARAQARGAGGVPAAGAGARRAGGAAAGGGGPGAVPRDRGEAVGARDRGADALDRVPPVLAPGARRRAAGRAALARHGHDRGARRGAGVGRGR